MLRLAFVFAPALLLAQTNLDFNLGTAGAEPPGWFVPQGLRFAGYRAEWRGEGCHGEHGCAVLMSPARPPESTFGNLMQSFDAAAYRGQTVRLRAWIRVEPAAPTNRAQVWLRVDLPNSQMGFFDNMGDRPITSSEWKQCEISGSVADNATAINFGVMSFGTGRVWVDGVMFEVVPQAGDEETAAARDALQKIYQRIDSAYASGELDRIAELATPGAAIHVGPQRMTLSSALQQIGGELKQGWKYASRSTISAVRISGDEATVAVNNESTRSKGAERQNVVTMNRDTWLKTAAGWRLKESALISYRMITAPTDPETAKTVATELKQHAVPLAGVEAGAPFTDLAAFGKAIGDARIVALGEATHGTREFFQMKHRLLEYLVKEKGFTVFAIEANWPEALAVDRYIKTGEGDPKSALAGMYFWTWRTEEVLDMIEWMRAFNKAPGKHPALTFTSFDMQTLHVAAQKALDYLKNYAPDEAGPAAAGYNEAQDLEARRTGQIFDEKAKSAAEKAAAVLKVFDSKHAELSAASGADAWRDARQAAAIVYQACTMRVPGTSGGYRDQMMAGNLEWLASQVHPNEKIVLWAHNGHVAFGSDGTQKSMGTWLRERYGNQMYVLGFAFERGELRAVGTRGGQYTGLAVHTAPASPAGSGDAVLAGAGLPLFFLDMAHLPAGGTLTRWLAEPHRFHEVGAIWNLDDPETNLLPKSLAKLYDGLIFVDETHAARGL